jgi:hypothetical protein
MRRELIESYYEEY